MNDETYQAGPVMINIDGSKIRKLREERGLTQLYIATAVEVTTDTVSRWENRRYPSIKKENGLKLAQALEVELEEILDNIETGEDSLPEQEAVTPETPRVPPLSRHSPAKRNIFLKRTAILLAAMLVPLLLFFLFSLYSLVNNGGPLSEVTVTRTVPPHFIAGQPFPVFLNLSSSRQDNHSFILREAPSPGITIQSTLPPLSDKQLQGKSIQWLGNLSGSATFAYALKSEKDFGGIIHFDGIVKFKSGPDSGIEVTGENSSRAGNYHWADRDRDNKISDEEILTVYDLVPSAFYDDIDMDLLEEIWLGEGYIWHPDGQRFSILD